MSSSEYTEIANAISRTFEQIGGRATHAEVFAHAKVTIAPELRDYLTDRGLSQQVSAFFRQQGTDGLPQAPAIDEHGTHAQLRLLEVEEFKFVIRQQMKASGASRVRAKEYQRLCQEQHGVWIPLTDQTADANTA